MLEFAIQILLTAMSTAAFAVMFFAGLLMFSDPNYTDNDTETEEED